MCLGGKSIEEILLDPEENLSEFFSWIQKKISVSSPRGGEGCDNKYLDCPEEILLDPKENLSEFFSWGGDGDGKSF